MSRYASIDVDAARRTFQASRLPSVVIDGAVESEEVDAMRASLADESFRSFDLAHRGHYEHLDVAIGDPIGPRLVGLVESITGRKLEIVRARWLRLRRGDYSLARDDVAWRLSTRDAPIEITLDVSEGASGEAEVVYTHRGRAYFTVPQVPGVLAIVERGPTVERYDRYLTHRVGERTVLRWRCALGFASETGE